MKRLLPLALMLISCGAHKHTTSYSLEQDTDSTHSAHVTHTEEQTTEHARHDLRSVITEGTDLEIETVWYDTDKADSLGVAPIVKRTLVRAVKTSKAETLLTLEDSSSSTLVLTDSLAQTAVTAETLTEYKDKEVKRRDIFPLVFLAAALVLVFFFVRKHALGK